MSQIPPKQAAMLDALRDLLIKNGFPGGFVIFFQEDEKGKTAMAGTLDADQTLKLLKDASEELGNDFGAGRTKQ